MSKLPVVTGRQAIQAFARLGFEEVRVRGSHHILKKPGHVFVLTVPVHGADALKPGLLRRLVRDAGVSLDEFVNAVDDRFP